MRYGYIFYIYEDICYGVVYWSTWKNGSLQHISDSKSTFGIISGKFSLQIIFEEGGGRIDI